MDIVIASIARTAVGSFGKGLKTVPAIDFTIGRTLVRYRGKMAIFTIDLTFAKPTGLGKEWALTVSLRPDAKGLNWKIVDTALEPVVGEK